MSISLDIVTLNEHKFRHNFQDCLNPLCLCSLEIQNTSHYLLRCQYYSEHRINLINNVKSISDDFQSFSDNVQRDILLYGYSQFDTNKNKLILEATISYIKTLIGLLDHFSVTFLYAKIHLITKFILVILSFLLYYYIFSTYVSPVNIDYCCQGSVACIFVYFSFLYNIVIIEKKSNIDKTPYK